MNSRYSGPVGPPFRGFTSCPSMFPSSAAVAADSIRIESLSIDSIIVLWDAPPGYCGPRRTFSVAVTPQGSTNALCTSDTSQSFIQCTGVVYGETYNVIVITRINCSDGTSLTSDSSTRPYTHNVIVDAPENVRFSRNGDVTLNWDRPVTSNGGTAISYNVYWSCGDTPQNAVVPSGTSYTLDISGQTTYAYCLGQVQACNNVSCGRLSDNVAVLIPLQPPPTPVITAAVNGTTVLIQFSISEPTDLGDLRYTLFRRPNSSTDFVPIISNMQYNYINVLRDDEPGEQETYQYQLMLHNSMGNSSRSNNVSVTTTQVRN